MANQGRRAPARCISSCGVLHEYVQLPPNQAICAPAGKLELPPAASVSEVLAALYDKHRAVLPPDAGALQLAFQVGASLIWYSVARFLCRRCHSMRALCLRDFASQSNSISVPFCREHSHRGARCVYVSHSHMTPRVGDSAGQRGRLDAAWSGTAVARQAGARRLPHRGLEGVRLGLGVMATRPAFG